MFTLCIRSVYCISMLSWHICPIKKLHIPEPNLKHNCGSGWCSKVQWRVHMNTLMYLILNWVSLSSSSHFFFVTYLLVLCCRRRLQLGCCIFFSFSCPDHISVCISIPSRFFNTLSQSHNRVFCNIVCRKAKFPYLMLLFNYFYATSKHVVHIRVCPFQYNGPQNPIVSYPFSFMLQTYNF